MTTNARAPPNDNKEGAREARGAKRLPFVRALRPRRQWHVPRWGRVGRKCGARAPLRREPTPRRAGAN